jgi:hypothetical protein
MPHHVFRHGSAGFAGYYWHTFVDQTDENLLVETIIPIALHKNGRFYTLGRGNFAKRLSYALSRALITREDSGGETFNTREIVGAGVSAGISSLYYFAQYSTWPRSGQRWLTNVLLDSSTFVVQEFWPDVNRTIFRRKNQIGLGKFSVCSASERAMLKP